MKSNEWNTMPGELLTDRIDSAPVLSDYINASISEQPENVFFFNGYLSDTRGLYRLSSSRIISSTCHSAQLKRAKAQRF